MRDVLLQAALAGMMSGLSAGSAQADTKPGTTAGSGTTSSEESASSTSSSGTQGELEKCWGINRCQNHTACGVSKSDIAATKESFKNKFSKSQTHDCSGGGACAARKGHLGWVQVAKGHCTKIEGGFLIVEQKGKKVVVKD